MRWDYPPLDINPVFSGLGGMMMMIIIIIIIIIIYHKLFSMAAALNTEGNKEVKILEK